MPNKYEVFVQNNGSLQRKFVAGGLAAAFGAGEFGNYAGAMKDVLLEKDLLEDDLVNKNKALDTKFEQALGLFMTKNPNEKVEKYLMSLKESFISKFQEYSQNLPTTPRDLLKNAYSIDPSAVIIHFDTLDRDTLILLSCISNVVLNSNVVGSENLSQHLSKLFVGRGLFYPTLRDVIASCYPELFSAMEGVVKKRKIIKGLFVTVCFFALIVLIVFFSIRNNNKDVTVDQNKTKDKTDNSSDDLTTETALNELNDQNVKDDQNFKDKV